MGNLDLRRPCLDLDFLLKLFGMLTFFLLRSKKLQRVRPGGGSRPAMPAMAIVHRYEGDWGNEVQSFEAQQKGMCLGSEHLTVLWLVRLRSPVLYLLQTAQQCPVSLGAVNTHSC
jgi:hypothetical protein